MLQVCQGVVGWCVRAAVRTHNSTIITPFWTLVSKCPTAAIATTASRTLPDLQETAVKQEQDDSQDLHNQQQYSLSEEIDQGVQSFQKDTEHKDLTHLLQRATEKGSINDAIKGLHILSDLVTVKKLDFKKDLEKEAKFSTLIDVIDEGVMRSSHSTLLYTLRKLLSIGVSSNSHVVQSIEVQLEWEMRKMSFPMLLSLLMLQSNHQQTEQQRRVLQNCVECVQRRWVEVQDGRDLETLYSLHTHLSPEFLGQLDDRATELVGSMPYTEQAKVLCVLGAIKRRATPVIRALTFHMAKQRDSLLPKQLSNLMFAMNVLSFPDPTMLEKIAHDLVPQVKDIDNPRLVGTILFSMGQMRWRHLPLLEALSNWTEKIASVCPHLNLSALTMTLATVGYEPSNADTLFPIITSRLTRSALPKHTSWLDVVWALTVLGRASNEHIASVLDPTFVSAVPPIEQHLRVGIKLKLLNINAVARLTMPSYSGPQLNMSEFKDVIITPRKDERHISQHVLKMLHNLLPPPKYIHQSIQTTMGIYVDAEFATDSNAKPLPLQELSNAFSQKICEGVGDLRINNSKDLPEGITKLALMVWNYKDYTIGVQELTGVNRLAVMLLRRQGYKIVQIPYYEYNMKGTTLKNVQYLEARIKEALTT